MSRFANRTFSLRPWAKTLWSYPWAYHLILYAPLVFDGKLLQPIPFLRTSLLVLCFALSASSVSVLSTLEAHGTDHTQASNDELTLTRGRLERMLSVALVVMVAGISLAVALWLDRWAAVIMAAYWVQQVGYAFYLQQVVLVDVLVFACGFVLQIAASAAVIAATHFSPWLYVCVTLLALFVGLADRRQALIQPDPARPRQDASQAQSDLSLLDQLVGLVTTSLLIAYTLYSFTAQTTLAGGGRLLLTVPFVFYFVARYLYLIHVRKLDGALNALWWRDKPLLADGLLWLGAVIILLYGGE